ncbi:glycosyltransferase family 4 protein [Thalassospira alkalitolerans]|uniref:glycosyltransferase family 4 protein n=1 Tax=Thalassospira alkalitolerans TaxID=1293890 RepID=UPI003AA8D8CA
MMAVKAPVKAPANVPVWMIGRIDQFRILATHLTRNNRLARWDSFWRHNGHGLITPPARKVDPILASIPGRHLLPDLLGKTAQKLHLPARNLYSDLPLSWLAATHMPDAKILHGQGNYSLPAMRRARTKGMAIISDVTGQLAPIRKKQLADEYHHHGLRYREISNLLARRRMAEARFADGVFAPSDAVAAGLVDCGINASRIHLVPFTSSLCDPLLAYDHGPSATSDDGTTHLLYVGNIAIAKGIRILIEAFRVLRHRLGPAITLSLVGPAHPCALAYLAKLPPGCVWQGPVAHKYLPDHLLSADIFVFPSLSEGSSLAVLEAMAASCAVITTPDAGSPITHNQNGILIPPRDSEALINAITDLHADPVKRTTLGRAARQVIAHDIADDYGTRVEAAYEKVLTRHG